MEIKQKRYSNRLGFVFGDDELKCSLQESSGSRKFSIAAAQPLQVAAQGGRADKKAELQQRFLGMMSNYPAVEVIATTPSTLLLTCKQAQQLRNVLVHDNVSGGRASFRNSGMWQRMVT